MFKKSFLVAFFIAFVFFIPLISKAIEDNLYRNNDYNFRIKFPSGWEIKDGDGEHIVKKAARDGSTVMIQVRDFLSSLSEEEKNILSDKEKMEVLTSEFNDFTDQDVEDFSNEIINEILEVYPGSKILEENIVYIDNRKAVYFKMNQVYKVQDLVVEGISINYFTIHKGKFFQIAGFYPKGDDYQELTIKTSLATFVFEDWNDSTGVTGTIKTPEEIKTTSLGALISEKNWRVLTFVLIAGILFTWGFGLLIPILFRFVFLKRPLTRTTAFLVAFFVWLIQLSVALVLDSKSKNHNALVLVAFVSYQILRWGALKKIKGAEINQQGNKVKESVDLERDYKECGNETSGTIMNCPNCKKEIDSDSNFCEFCGEKLNYVSNDAREEMPIHKGFLFSRNKKEKPSIIKDLEKKVWYRALKIAYILGILISFLFSFFYMIHEFSFWEDATLFFLVYFLATFIIFESIKRAFYYIYFGNTFFTFKSKK